MRRFIDGWTCEGVIVRIACMEMYPLKFRPIFKQRIWGGQKLREVFDKDIPPFERIGESWELADLPSDKSEIVNGELAGMTLRAAVEKYSEEITGSKEALLPFPLLIKFLDAEDVLSVQVHPDEQTCQRMGKGDAKTECWYIISASAEACIYKGLKEGVSKEQFARAIEAGTVEELLNKVKVKKGECHFLPAGTAHAIGPGLLIAEIQTPSDTTYRVFDWNRVDEKGAGRELHIEQALESIHFGQSQERFVTTVGRLVDCEHFVIDKGHQLDGCEVLLAAGEMKVLLILSGFGEIESSAGVSIGFKSGDCIIVPASYEGVFLPGADTEYLLVKI